MDPNESEPTITNEDEKNEVDVVISKRKTEVDNVMKEEKTEVDNVMKEEKTEVDNVIKEEKTEVDIVIKEEKTEVDNVESEEKSRVNDVVSEEKLEVDDLNEEKTIQNADSMLDEFLNEIQKISVTLHKQSDLSFITSRSTSANINLIEKLLSEIERICKNEDIPIQENSVSKNNCKSVKLLKYLICKTKFSSQHLLAKDSHSSHFVDVQFPLSTYLFIEILWHLHFEEILAESMLYLPLDLCYEILEILPRCLDLLNFQRGVKFLLVVIQNVYQKFIIMKDTGTQTQNMSQNIQRLIANLLELISQFKNERFLKLQDIPKKSERYKKQGVLLKKIIRMIKACFTYKLKPVKTVSEIEKLYELTFGMEPFIKIEETKLEEYFKEIDRALISLLLEKVKEIDCHIYLEWMEYDDEDNTSITLQRAVGLECHYFIEEAKNYNLRADIKEFNHLIECLQQLSSKPDPENKLESLQIEDLREEVIDGKRENVITLFKRYKEWDNNSIALIDKNVHLFSKEDCEELFEYFAAQINNTSDSDELDKLQSYALRLFKSVIGLKLLELYELSIQCILRYSESSKFQYVVDIEDFERFIMLNPNFSTPKNLRIVLFYLCLQPKLTLKIILKIALGHSDYPNVAFNIDELVSLQPFMKIQMPSNYENIMDSLRSKPSENKRSKNNLSNGSNKDSNTDDSGTVSLIVMLLQEICLESSKWNLKKFTDLLYMLYSLCEYSEIINEIFLPLLASPSFSADYIKWILTELEKLRGKFNLKDNKDLFDVLEKQAFNFLKNTKYSKFTVDESLTLIINQMKSSFGSNYEPIYFNYSTIFLELPVFPNQSQENRLTENIGRIMCLYQEKTNNTLFSSYLNTNDVIRYLLFKCTNSQYLKYVKEIASFYGYDFLNWTTELQVYDKIIRFAFENCLLSLEFPETGPEDSISFSIRRLHRLISTIKNSNLNKFLMGELCTSLESHATLMKPSIEQTSISYEFTQLLNSFHKANLEIDSYLNALDVFAYSCVQKSSTLKTFEGPCSPLGIKLYLLNDVLDSLLDDEMVLEEQLKKLSEYLK